MKSIQNYIEMMDKDYLQTKAKEIFTVLGERFKTARASIKYHDAEKGGLYNHTLKVVKYAVDFRNTNQKFDNVRGSSVIFCALFHDLGKIGDEFEDYYEYDEEKHCVAISPYFNGMGHEMLTLYWMTYFGVHLDIEEFQALYGHAWPWCKAMNGVKPYGLTILIHQADMQAVFIG